MNKLDFLLVAVCASALITNAVILYAPKLENTSPMALIAKTSQANSDGSPLLVEIKRLEHALTVMDDRLMRMEKLIAAEHIAAEVNNSANPEAKIPPKKLSVAEIEQKNQALRQAANTKLSESFASEVVDTEWSANTVQLIRDKFAQSEKLAQVNLANADCKASLCRLEIFIEEPSQLATMEEELPFLLAEELPRSQVFTEQQSDGTSRVEIFLARNGYKLP